MPGGPLLASSSLRNETRSSWSSLGCHIAIPDQNFLEAQTTVTLLAQTGWGWGHSPETISSRGSLGSDNR
jgi:hypothetical protein